jgi:SOS-response transcriptional repressor LexA
MKPFGLGKHDAKVEAFVQSYRAEFGLSPSVREIMTNCGITSTSVVTYTLKRMSKARGDTYYPRKHRGYAAK